MCFRGPIVTPISQALGCSLPPRDLTPSTATGPLLLPCIWSSSWRWPIRDPEGLGTMKLPPQDLSPKASHKALTGLRVGHWEGPGSWNLTRAAGATGSLISPSFESILTQGTTKKAQRRPGLKRNTNSISEGAGPQGNPLFS